MHLYPIIERTLPRAWPIGLARRFLELKQLLQAFLIQRITLDEGCAGDMASQLLNVLENCDAITYEEAGTAEAYALLHFLDRFHRFQLTFHRLHTLGLMPVKSRNIDVLDVGTGPGPSMFALSDFYVAAKGTGLSLDEGWGKQGFEIDYVERSRAFRHWLHHFTEYANYACPSKRPWWVPFHHGTFHDFKGLNFTSTRFSSEYDDDGDLITRTVKVKHRYDLVVFSYFLTTRSQVQEAAKELQDCARYLRHNGILLVVGARATSRKYAEVYEEMHRVIVEGRYSNRKLKARCAPVDIGESVLRYSWGDSHGKRLKSLTATVLKQLQATVPGKLPAAGEQILEESVRPEYSRKIEWQVFVFKKSARPR